MKTYFSKGLKALGLISLCSIPLLTPLPNTEDLTYKIELNNNNKLSSNQSISVNYNAGSWKCTGGSYMVDVRGNFDQQINIDLPLTAYNNSLYVANRIIAKAFDLTNTNEIRDIVYDRSTNVISFTSPAFFYLRCQHIKHPQDLPGMQPLPPQHVHSNLHGVRIKNTNISKLPDREYAKDAKVVMQLSGDIFSSAVDLNAIKFNNLLQIDDQKTFRGFNANYFGLKANNEYLKALTISAENTKWLNQFKTKPEYQRIKQNVKFEKVLNLAASGLLFDFNSAFIQKILDKEVLNNVSYNVNHWINKIINEDLSFEKIDLIKKTKYVDWVKKYDLHALPQFNYDFMNLIFDNKLKFNLVWTSNDNQTQTTNFNLIYADMHKQFNLLDESNQQIMLTVKHDEMNDKFIKILSVNWLSDGSFNHENQNVPFLNKDHELVFANQQNYISNPQFDIKKLITINPFQSAFDWVRLLDLSKYAEADAMGVPIVLDNPESLIKNPEYLKALLQFNLVNNAITIYDNVLKQGLMQNSDTLYENKQLTNFITDFLVKAYNSKNQVILSFKYKDFNADGSLNSESEINHEIILDLTPYKVTESTNSETTNNSIEIEQYEDTNLLTSFILENHIQYADNAIIQNPIIKTTLTKNDWITNAFIDLVVNNKTEEDWTCTLRYNNFVNKENYKNSDEAYLDFILVFNQKETEVVLPEDKQEIKKTETNRENWIMWACIGVGIFLVLMMIMLYIYTKKQQAKQDV